ncbi:DUF3052 domain-containing protein [Streptomyces sp. AP-93]|nr:DUF3052 domain-containing protein [Streptomyces sp. AP-93]
MVLLELGWGEDVDNRVRKAVEARAGAELLDEEADKAADVVLLRWRGHDGDLVDALIDAIGSLAEDGIIWVLTPKSGRDGYVEPSDIAEAVPTAGLAQTTSTLLAMMDDDFIGTRTPVRTILDPGEALSVRKSSPRCQRAARSAASRVMSA